MFANLAKKEGGGVHGGPLEVVVWDAHAKYPTQDLQRQRANRGV